MVEDLCDAWRLPASRVLSAPGLVVRVSKFGDSVFVELEHGVSSDTFGDAPDLESSRWILESL
jgi:hypothetical protein